ncbi:MAG: NAD(P)/FAD-dependent oxidoreductase [Clostridia bacterium]|nr:NAD(P)/FAD-dependent oxidoreductase [Clostridia bacterium]
MKVIVIGGGPAGMLSAISSARLNNKVTLIEKNNILGKKMLITGKGRCNITSSIDMDEFIKNIPGNGKFLYSSFQNFNNEDIINLLKNNGLEVKEERGNRVFPVTDKAQSVVDALISEIKKYNIDIKLNKNVSEILVKSNEVCGVKLDNGEEISATKVILATGGKSYSSTGSNGDGYEISKKLGHTIVEPRGSLVPMTADVSLCQSLQGLSLRNVKILIKDVEKNKKIYDDFGEMLFTHFGVSGPTILSASAHLLRYKNFGKNNIKLFIDLKPALDNEALDLRVRRDFEEFKNKDFKNSLEKLLPQKMIPVIIELSKINPNKKVNEITREERLDLVKLIKNFEVTITGFRPVDEAIVTAGGISIKEIDPKTMESKIISGLFFAGEIIDVDAYTGGFNLQIAYSTGFTAGM